MDSKTRVKFTLMAKFRLLFACSWASTYLALPPPLLTLIIVLLFHFDSYFVLLVKPLSITMGYTPVRDEPETDQLYVNSRRDSGKFAVY